MRKSRDDSESRRPVQRSLFGEPSPRSAGPRSPPGPTPTRSPGITAGSVASLDTTDAVAPSEPRCETVGDTHYSDGLNIWRKQMRCELGESHNENGSMHCVTTKFCVIHFR